MPNVASDVRSRLTEDLLAWLEAERSASEQALLCLGLAPSINVHRPVVRWGDSNSFELWEQPTLLSPVASLAHDVPGLANAGRAIELLTSVYGQGCLYAYPHLDSQLGVEQRFALYVLELRDSYLRALTSIAEPNSTAAREYVESFLEYLEVDYRDEVSVLPIGGLVRPDSPLEVDGVTIRALTGTEAGELFQPRMEPFRESPGNALPHTLRSFEPCVERCMLIVRVRRPKASRISQNVRLSKIVVGLQLCGFEICGTGRGAIWHEPGPRHGIGGFSVALPKSQRTDSVCGVADVQRAIELADHMSDDSFPTGSDVPIHRFVSGTAQGHASEAVIDYCIGLESLLLPGIRAESSFRLRLNGARYLEDAPDEREKTFAEFRRLYDCRSTLVHGGIPKRNENPDDLRPIARSLLSRCLTKALMGGRPTAEQFEAAALA